MTYPQFHPFSLGQVMTTGENILNARASRDPNSLKNQLLRAQLAQKQGDDGLKMAPISFKDATAGSIAAAIQANDPSLLERVPYKPWSVDTKTHRIFYDINPVTRESREIDRIPIENFTAAYDAAAGGAAVAEGLPNPMANTAISPDDLKIPVATAKKPYVPKSEAELTRDKTTAQEEAKADVKEKVELKRLSKVYNTYKVGMNKLKTALSKTMGGPIVGRLPAMTAEAQIAEQAKAMMLPILKAIVRGAGEGVFTDQDAQAVLALIPDRIADEAARDEIFSNIDAFISSKLQMATVAEPRTGGGLESDFDMEDYNKRKQRLLSNE